MKSLGLFFRSLALGFVLLILSPQTAKADVVVDLGAFYYSDTFVYSSVSSSYSRMLIDVSFGMSLGKKGRWVLAWNYDSMALTESPAGVANKLTVTDMGPKITYYLDKDCTLPFSFTYDLITKGKYQAGSAAAVELRGTAMKVDFGYTPEVSEGLFLGAKINYYKPSFNESVINTSITKTSNSRTVIYPSFSLTYRFG